MMLYNYPKTDFYKFYDEVYDSAPNAKRPALVRQQSSSVQVFDSIANLRPLIINMDLSGSAQKPDRARATAIGKQTMIEQADKADRNATD